LILIISGLLLSTKDSFASDPKIIGFVIEATQMEGTMQEPTITAGDTTEQKNQPMLELKFENLSAEGLTIKKLIKSPKGIETIEMSPEDKVLFSNLSLKVTNAQFSENYLPTTGNFGIKNIKLLAHSVTANHSILPQFKLSLNEGGQVEMESKSEEELLQMKTYLQQLISSTP
jgi:hypothetical protein